MHTAPAIVISLSTLRYRAAAGQGRTGHQSLCIPTHGRPQSARSRTVCVLHTALRFDFICFSQLINPRLFSCLARVSGIKIAMYRNLTTARMTFTPTDMALDCGTDPPARRQAFSHLSVRATTPGYEANGRHTYAVDAGCSLSSRALNCGSSRQAFCFASIAPQVLRERMRRTTPAITIVAHDASSRARLAVHLAALPASPIANMYHRSCIAPEHARLAEILPGLINCNPDGRHARRQSPAQDSLRMGPG